MRKFVSDTLDESRSSEFLRDFQAFQEHAAFFGYLNSLSQLTLKMTSPGVPDLYQGCELWDFNLVDPDNRRPIDFDSRRRILQQLKSGVADSTEGLQRLLLKLETGAVKMYVLWRALLFRQSHHQLFQEGIYLPLNATGEKAQHIVAFARQLGKQFVITVAPRLVAGLCNKAKVLPLAEKIWGDTVLRLNDKIPASGFRNVLTGETMAGSKKDLRLSEILANFPVAILDGSHQ